MVAVCWPVAIDLTAPGVPSTTGLNRNGASAAVVDLNREPRPREARHEPGARPGEPRVLRVRQIDAADPAHASRDDACAGLTGAARVTGRAGDAPRPAAVAGAAARRAALAGACCATSAATAAARAVDAACRRAASGATPGTADPAAGTRGRAATAGGVHARRAVRSARPRRFTAGVAARRAGAATAKGKRQENDEQRGHGGTGHPATMLRPNPCCNPRGAPNRR